MATVNNVLLTVHYELFTKYFADKFLSKVKKVFKGIKVSALWEFRKINKMITSPGCS